MPKGFVQLERNRRDHTYRVAADQIARYGKNNPDGSYVVLKTLDSGENETLYVVETPEEIDALIEAAQGEAPRRSEFAQAMGHAIGAFGGGR